MYNVFNTLRPPNLTLFNQYPAHFSQMTWMAGPGRGGGALAPHFSRGFFLV